LINEMIISLMML